MGLHCSTCVCVGELADPGVDTVGPFHRDGRRTEVSAAYDVLPRSGTQRLRVLEFLLERGTDGATDNEMEVALEMCRPSPGNRRNELVQGGWVYDTGQERRTENGNLAIVWAVTPEGRRRFTSQTASTKMLPRRRIVRTPSARSLQQQQEREAEEIGPIRKTNRGNLGVVARAEDSPRRAKSTRGASSTGTGRPSPEEMARARDKMMAEKRAAAANTA